MTALGRRLYAVGGRLAGADTNLALVESYRPGAKKWRRLRPVPSKRGGTAAAGLLGRWLVSAGGETPTVTIRASVEAGNFILAATYKLTVNALTSTPPVWLAM